MLKPAVLRLAVGLTRCTSGGFSLAKRSLSQVQVLLQDSCQTATFHREQGGCGHFCFELLCLCGSTCAVWLFLLFGAGCRAGRNSSVSGGVASGIREKMGLGLAQRQPKQLFAGVRGEHHSSPADTRRGAPYDPTSREFQLLHCKQILERGS